MNQGLNFIEAKLMTQDNFIHIETDTEQWHEKS